VQLNMWKRLDSIEDSFAAEESKNGIVFMPLKGESMEEYDARILRWKSGAKVEGQDRICTGRESLIGIIEFVPATRKNL
jgi:hypothetical protein